MDEEEPTEMPTFSKVFGEPSDPMQDVFKSFVNDVCNDGKGQPQHQDGGNTDAFPFCFLPAQKNRVAPAPNQQPSKDMPKTLLDMPDLVLETILGKLEESKEIAAFASSCVDANQAVKKKYNRPTYATVIEQLDDLIKNESKNLLYKLKLQDIKVNLLNRTTRDYEVGMQLMYVAPYFNTLLKGIMEEECKRATKVDKHEFFMLMLQDMTVIPPDSETDMKYRPFIKPSGDAIVNKAIVVVTKCIDKNKTTFEQYVYVRLNKPEYKDPNMAKHMCTLIKYCDNSFKIAMPLDDALGKDSSSDDIYTKVLKPMRDMYCIWDSKEEEPLGYKSLSNNILISDDILKMQDVFALKGYRYYVHRSIKSPFGITPGWMALYTPWISYKYVKQAFDKADDVKRNNVRVFYAKAHLRAQEMLKMANGIAKESAKNAIIDQYTANYMDFQVMRETHYVKKGYNLPPAYVSRHFINITTNEADVKPARAVINRVFSKEDPHTMRNMYLAHTNKDIPDLVKDAINQMMRYCQETMTDKKETIRLQTIEPEFLLRPGGVTEFFANSRFFPSQDQSILYANLQKHYQFQKMWFGQHLLKGSWTIDVTNPMPVRFECMVPVPSIGGWLGAKKETLGVFSFPMEFAMMFFHAKQTRTTPEDPVFNEYMYAKMEDFDIKVFDLMMKECFKPLTADYEIVALYTRILEPFTQLVQTLLHELGTEQYSDVFKVMKKQLDEDIKTLKEPPPPPTLGGAHNKVHLLGRWRKVRLNKHKKQCVQIKGELVPLKKAQALHKKYLKK